MQVGSRPLQPGFGLRSYVDKPDGGPDWGLRFVVDIGLSALRSAARTTPPTRRTPMHGR
ncbi:MAG: hypothetical protein RML45_06425 [Acetobacteraceae bacterium]|nr:hypothetical protein [Acetobacteraceae bacterium]